MGKTHERRGDQQRAESATSDEASAAPTQEKQIANGQAGDAAARRMAGAEDDGMRVEDSDPETERLRGEIKERVNRQQTAVRDAVDKWQIILMRRKAEGTIKRGLSREGVQDRFKDSVFDYFKDKVFDVGKDLAKEVELTPGLGAVASAVGKVKGVVDDNTKAEQAEAETNAIAAIVADTVTQADAAGNDAKERINVAFHAQVRAWAETPEYPIDQHAIIGRLDALLLKAMRESGAQSVNDSLDALRERGNLDGEIDKADSEWAKHANRNRGGGK